MPAHELTEVPKLITYYPLFALEAGLGVNFGLNDKGAPIRGIIVYMHEGVGFAAILRFTSLETFRRLV